MRARYTLIEHRAKFDETFGAKATWEGPGLYNRRTGYMMDAGQEDVICAPMVVRDTPAYYSVVSDKWIDGRRDRREDLISTNSVEFDPPARREKRPLLNKAFAKRNNKLHLYDADRAQDAKAAQKKITDDIDKHLFGKGL